MIVKKFFHNILVFLTENGAGGVQKRPTEPDTRGRPVRDPLLNCRKSGKRFGIFVTDLRLFPNHAHTGARYVRNHKIKALPERFIRSR